MPFEWNQISLDQVVAHERMLGQKICEVDGVCWSQVSPFFYRPLPTFTELDPGQVRPPRLALLGGVQHAVPRAFAANSFLNYLVFERPGAYSIATLDSEKRRRIKISAANFTVRIMTDAERFKAQAYPVYLDFHLRTGYAVGSNRVQQEGFCRWADALFGCPGLLILGAYRGEELWGVCTSFRFERTLYCASLICLAGSLRLHLPNFLLHVIRDSAAASPGLEHVFPGMYHGNTTLDAFYIERGAKILRKPAHFAGNPLALALVRKFRPSRFARLTGALSEQEMAWVSPESRHPAETFGAPQREAVTC